MDELRKLKDEIEELQNRLREETRLRMDLERRCNLLEKLAFRDPSTGLRTESYLHARVREEIDRAIRFPAATSLVTICAPKERAENITRLGQRLSDELRLTDQVFRLSGHGLALLLIETPEDGAHMCLNRLSEALEQFVRGYGYTVTSFPVHANLADDFLNLALERHQEIAKSIHPNTAEQTHQSAAIH